MHLDVPVRTLIIDEEDLYREGLAILFQRDPEIRIVGRARTAAEGCEKARRLQPDVVLMELNMRDTHGLQAARAIAADAPGAKIALIAKRFTRAELLEGISAGVRGYITRDVALPTLLNAIKSVARGEVVMPPESSGVLVEELVAMSGGDHRQQEASAADRAKVTDREREVLELLVHGATNRDIANRLQITENTVKVHLRNILDKLHLRNRQQAAAFAISSGLVQLQREGIQRAGRPPQSENRENASANHSLPARRRARSFT
jgi:DNA-binding NarL/FixJ family response regulator